MRRKLKHFYRLAAISLLIVACGANKAELSCDVSFTEADPANLAVNIYVDGTPSMQGFTTSSQGAYAQSIDALRTMMTLDEPVTLSGERGRFAREPLYFRLGANGGTGNQTQEVSESEYREAAFSDFYDGSNVKFPLLNVAELDAAISSISGGDGLTVIITDLYQGEDNIKTVTQSIKTVLSQSPEQAVGLVGAKSDFEGTVYKEALRDTSSFSFNGLHPFYVLFIGRVDDVHFYVSKLTAALGSGIETEATVFSSSRFYDEPIMLNRKDQSDLIDLFENEPDTRKQISIPAAAMKAGNTVVTFDDENIQPLSFRSNAADSVSFPGNSRRLVPIPYVLPLSDLGSVVTVASSRDPEPFASSSRVSAFSLNDIEETGDSVRFSAQFDVESLSKSEIQFVEASLVPEGGLSTQQWWSDWNAADSENDGTKTNNLEEFAKQLRSTAIARIDQNPPTIGNLCYAIEKQ